jgi:tRNA pseudouridine55 synthase
MSNNTSNNNHNKDATNTTTEMQQQQISNLTTMDNGTTGSTTITNKTTLVHDDKVPLLLSEGLVAVYKPIDWSSSKVVTHIRVMLERDALNDRGYQRKPKQKKPLIKCGHGGTLDPLATGVLVLGIGSGTKLLQPYVL